MNILKYPFDYYTPSSVTIAHTLTMPQARAEYSRLRKITNARLERFKGTEWEDTDFFKVNYGRFPKLSDIKSERELLHNLSALSYVATSQRATVTGNIQERNQKIETLHKHGYDWVNKDNFQKFSEFMDAFRAQKLSQIYDSEQAVDIAEILQDKDVDTDYIFMNFQKFANDMDALETYVNKQSGRNISKKKLQKFLKDMPKKKKRGESRRARREARKNTTTKRRKTRKRRRR